MNNNNYEPNLEFKVGGLTVKIKVQQELLEAINDLDGDEAIMKWSLATEFQNFLRSAIKLENRPATEGQLSMINSISYALDIDTAEYDISTTSACTEFISHFSDELDQVVGLKRAMCDEDKAVVAKARKCFRGKESLRLQDMGKPLTEVAFAMGVKVPTIEKYIAEFNSIMDDIHPSELEVVNYLCKEIKDDRDPNIALAKVLYQQGASVDVDLCPI